MNAKPLPPVGAHGPTTPGTHYALAAERLLGFWPPGAAGIDQNQQVWRMDFDPPNKGHKTRKSYEIEVWEDTPFHYHVMKPGQ